MSRNIPYNDYPYLDYPYLDFPYAVLDEGRQKRRGSSSRKDQSYTGGGGHWILLLVYTFLYSPFLWIGYRVIRTCLPADASILSAAPLILLTGWLTYQSYALLKGIYISCRKRGLRIWSTLFITVNGLFFCLPTICICLRLTASFPHPGLPTFALLPSAIALLVFYFYHQPLRSSPPRFCGTVFRLGLSIGGSRTEAFKFRK